MAKAAAVLFFSKKAKVHIDTKLERRRTLLMPCYFCHFFSNLFCCYSSRAGVLLTIHCTFHHIIVREEEPFTNQLFIIFYSKNIPNHSLLKLWKSFFILLHYYPCSLCSVHFLNWEQQQLFTLANKTTGFLFQIAQNSRMVQKKSWKKNRNFGNIFQIEQKFRLAF